MKHLRHPLFLLASIILILAIVFKQSQFFTLKQQVLPEIEDLKSSWQFFHSKEWHMNKAKPADQTYLIADKIEAYQTQKTTQLHHPVLIRQTEDNLYSLQAAQAKVYQASNQQHFEFTNNVVLVNYDTKAPHNWQNRLSGEQIQYFSETQQLKSQGFAQIEQPGLVISGNNLYADLQKQDFSFQHPVKTLYSPH